MAEAGECLGNAMETEEEEACQLPCCSTLELCPTSPASTQDIVTQSLAAYTPQDSVWPWEEYNVLRVRFLNVSFMREKKWTVGNGESMNTINILGWANVWSERGGGKIPRFVEAKPREPAEIRVLFNNRGQCNSKVGTKAQSVEAGQPTMNLDLQTNCNTAYKRHLVIHEFGHALGLGHEHQRSTFWSDIRPHIDQKRMKGYLKGCFKGLSGKDFEHFWENNYAADKCSELGSSTAYDPDSIMHYWFKRDWLKNPYNNIDYVRKCEREKLLPEKQVKALLGVHRRHHKLADDPSELDIQLLREVYGGDETERDGVVARVTHDGRFGDVRRVEADSLLTASSVGGMSNLSSVGGLGSFSDSGASLASVGDPNDMAGCYDGEVENRHMSRIDYKDSAGKERELEIYDQAACQWRKIGELLGLEKGTLISIERDGHDDRDRVTKVFEHWMNNADNLPNSTRYPKTWGGLVLLLKRSKLADLSGKLKDALLARESSLRENF